MDLLLNLIIWDGNIVIAWSGFLFEIVRGIRFNKSPGFVWWGAIRVGGAIIKRGNMFNLLLRYEMADLYMVIHVRYHGVMEK